jgi:hypothetical protein
MTTGTEVPQADRLDLVRRLVNAVSKGATTLPTAALGAHLAPRYAGYAAQAARQLGLLETDPDGSLRVSASASRLLATAEGSSEEKRLLLDAFTASPTLSRLATLVLSESPPSRTALADVIASGWPLSPATALRRATTLLTWRAYLLQEGEQLRFLGTDWDESSVDVTAEPDEASAPSERPHGRVLVSPSAPVSEAEPSEAPIGDAAELQASLENLAAPSPAAAGDEKASALPDAIAPPAPATNAEPTPTAGAPAASTAPDAIAAAAVTSFSSAPLVSAPTRTATEILSENNRAYFERQLRLGNLVLLTGAGFSLAARDSRSRTLPLGGAVATELWAEAFPGEPYDNSSLQDVFEALHRSNPKRLAKYLKERFSIDSGSLPAWYQTWFAMPWLKIYTLNVDDLESVAATRFDLPRQTRAVSALEGQPPLEPGDLGTQLDTIHLNGIASDGPSGVTFSGEQFATRLGRQEPYYAFLAAEMLTRSFVFVGSPLDEPLLWQHLALRNLRTPQSANELRPKCFLLSPTLGRARTEKLRAWNIVHVPATAEEFAKLVLEPMKAAADEGLRRLSAVAIASTDDARNVVDVATVVDAKDTKTGFLVGEEPVWSDIRHGRAVERDEDANLFEKLGTFAKQDEGTPKTVVVSGTAGAGKTTLLMKSALFLHSNASRCAWIGTDAQVSPRTLGREFRDDKYDVLLVDDAGRYGAHLSGILRELHKGASLRLIVLGVRSFHNHALQEAAPDYVHTVGPLTDGDIDRLLAVLERERLLGVLRSKKPAERRAAFKMRAARQLLVAMLETTSGERFEDKVINEWAAQKPEGQFIYALAALATWLGYPLTREEILLASRGGPRELEALRDLEVGRLLVADAGRYRARHRVIAETLVEELTSRGSQIDHVIVGLARALARPGEAIAPKGSLRRRVLVRLLSHDWLLRVLDGIEPARGVYGSLEEYLDRDYHFWLQRGCLELEAGDVKFAQNYIQQAAGINATDPLVETANAHMELRTAIANAAAPGASDAAAHAFETLRRLATARPYDHYVAHVFGSQALGWCRRASLTSRARLALLREAKEIVNGVLAKTKRREELRQLLWDLKKEELTPTAAP